MLDRLLDVLFGGQLTVAPVVVVLDQLRASAYFNEPTRARLVAMYQHFEELAAGALDDIYPAAAPDRRRAVAYALLCLGDANNSFRAAGFPGTIRRRGSRRGRGPARGARARTSTERLVITPPSTQSRTLNPMVRATSGGGDPDFLRALVESLPAAAFVIDTDGNVQFATRAAADLVECAPDALVGRSVLEFVDEDTAWAYAAAVAMAGDHPNVVMGPMRIIVVAGDGRSKPADLWATNRLDDPDVNGIVCLLTAETTAVGLADAIGAVANDADFPTVATRVVRAMQGHPTVAEAVLLSAGPSGFPGGGLVA